MESIVARMRQYVNLAKKHEADVILVLAVALISLLSFAVGYLTAKEQLKEPLRLEIGQQEVRAGEDNL